MFGMETTREHRSKPALHKCTACGAIRRIVWTFIFTSTRGFRLGRYSSTRSGARWIVPGETALHYGERFPSHAVACACGGPMVGRLIEGTHNDAIACDGRCTAAKGHRCECSCGGANHGADHG